MENNTELQEEIKQRVALYFRLIDDQGFQNAMGALGVAAQLARVEQSLQLRRIADTLAKIEAALLLRGAQL